MGSISCTVSIYQEMNYDASMLTLINLLTADGRFEYRKCMSRPACAQARFLFDPRCSGAQKYLYRARLALLSGLTSAQSTHVPRFSIMLSSSTVRPGCGLVSIATKDCPVTS